MGSSGGFGSSSGIYGGSSGIYGGSSGGFGGSSGGYGSSNGGFGSGGSIANCRQGQNCNIGSSSGQYNNGQYNPYNTGSSGQFSGQQSLSSILQGRKTTKESVNFGE